MNKTIIININSIVFHIEEDAYEMLRVYMIDIKRHFSTSADSGEILQDIENRIAEMFSEHIKSGRKEVINKDDVALVISQMGRVSDFEDLSDEEVASNKTFTKEEESQSEENKSFRTGKKLMRDPDDTTVGGVCSGLGHYFGIQSKWMRILFILFVLFGGSGVILYVILWVVMPLATSRVDRMAMRGEAPNLHNFKKNFEEEMEGVRENFSGASGHINRGVDALSTGLAGIFKFIGKFLGFTFLVFAGASIFGLFFFFLACTLAILGYQHNIYFPPLEVLEPGQAFIALLAGTFATMLPFVALFHILLRLLFKTQRMSYYLSLGLWATWIVSVMLVIFYCVVGTQDFREDSTIKVEKPLKANSTFYFSEKDARVIEASADGKKKYNIQLGDVSLHNLLRSEINIRFESVDSLEKPFVQYNYAAKGKTYTLAADRASRISYEAEQLDNKIFFNSHFTLNKDDRYRDQHVDVVVFLPVGTKVVVDNSLERKLSREVNFGECYNRYPENTPIKQTDWVMTKYGLSCALPAKEETKSEDTENE